MEITGRLTADAVVRTVSVDRKVVFLHRRNPILKQIPFYQV